MYVNKIAHSMRITSLSGSKTGHQNQIICTKLSWLIDAWQYWANRTSDIKATVSSELFLYVSYIYYIILHYTTQLQMCIMFLKLLLLFSKAYVQFVWAELGGDVMHATQSGQINQFIVPDVDARPPPIIYHGPQNQTLPVNSVAIMPCSASGEPSPLISWHRNNKPMPVRDPRFVLLDSGTLQITGMHAVPRTLVRSF